MFFVELLDNFRVGDRGVAATHFQAEPSWPKEVGLLLPPGEKCVFLVVISYGHSKVANVVAYYGLIGSVACRA